MVQTLLSRRAGLVQDRGKDLHGGDLVQLVVVDLVIADEVMEQAHPDLSGRGGGRLCDELVEVQALFRRHGVLLVEHCRNGTFLSG